MVPKETVLCLCVCVWIFFPPLGLPGSASTKVMCKAGQAGKRREGLVSSGAPGSFFKRAITSSEVGRIPSWFPKRAFHPRNSVVSSFGSGATQDGSAAQGRTEKSNGLGLLVLAKGGRFSGTPGCHVLCVVFCPVQKKVLTHRGTQGQVAHSNPQSNHGKKNTRKSRTSG